MPDDGEAAALQPGAMVRTAPLSITRPAGLRVLTVLGGGAISGLAVAGILLVAVAAFSRPAVRPVHDPEELANAWVETVAQFGISPIFPPQEDIRVGDVFAILGDGAGSNRLKIKAPRAIKLDHLRAVDTLLADEFREVIVLPSTPSAAIDARPGINQAKCDDAGCFELSVRKVLPLVIFPGIKAARAQQMELRANLADRIGTFVFGAAREDAQSVSIDVPYAESYGLGSLQASGILSDYCADPARPKLCDEDTLRAQLRMVAGDTAWQRRSGSLEYENPVYLVLVSAVYVTRSITYGLSADTSVGMQAQVVRTLQKRLDAEARTDAEQRQRTADGSVAVPAPEALAMQRALEQERQRLVRLIEEGTGAPAGTRVNVASVTSDRVVIDQVLPRPVSIGFIPVMKDYRVGRGKSDVVEPE